VTLLIAALSLCFNENQKIATISLNEIMPKDFSGKNLRGRNFKGQNLTGAKFIGADIRGANFTNAILREADFTRAKSGLQRRWTIFLVTISLFLSLISGLISGLTTLWVQSSFTPDNIKEYTLIPGVLLLIVLAIFFIVTIRQGLMAGVQKVAGAAAGVGTALAAVAAVGAATAVAAAVATGAVAVAVAGAVAGAATAVATGAAAVVVAAVVAGTGAGTVAAAVTGLGIYVAWCALAGDEKQELIRIIAVAFATTGGTSFHNADLTDANFTEATLKSTDFRTANLTRTCFRNTEKLDRTRVGNSILADTCVRELLITGNGYKKSYVGADLKGANLAGVNLNEANLKQANLSEATLHQANLESANLTETQALATDFTAASFTGACLEAWNIDASTKLDRVDCRFVYHLENAKPGTGDRDRLPHHINKCFEPGDFEKHKKIMETVQILLKDGINLEAFATAFQNSMQEFPEITRYSIQGFEKKENDVLITFKSPEGTDKGKFEQSWCEGYQAGLQAQRQADKLKNKDEIIAIHKDNYEELMKRVFSKDFLNPSTVPQPSSPIINIHNQSTAENKIASDNIDRSRKTEISGGTINATGAGSLSLGDNDGTTANTIEELPDSAVSAALEEDRPS
jgi:uncharacterized protein YjbI with pentapeptide repeats